MFDLWAPPHFTSDIVIFEIYALRIICKQFFLWKQWLAYNKLETGAH